MTSFERATGEYLPGKDSATQGGRDLLEKGLPGSAIDSFQRALSAGEPAAPAINGMGVAYARLGRLDLAKHFFEKAIAEEPANERYRDNLTLLLSSTKCAVDQQGDYIGQVTRADRPDDQSSILVEGDRKARAAPGKRLRILRNEVYIVTARAHHAPVLAAGRALNFHVMSVWHVALNDPELQHSVPLVRFGLPQANFGINHSPNAQLKSLAVSDQ